MYLLIALGWMLRLRFIYLVFTTMTFHDPDLFRYFHLDVVLSIYPDHIKIEYFSFPAVAIFGRDGGDMS